MGQRGGAALNFGKARKIARPFNSGAAAPLAP